MLKKILAGATISIILAGSPARADVRQYGEDENFLVYEITGIISKADVAALATLRKTAKNSSKGVMFHLNSDGGDVEAAIELGRQLRTLQAFALTRNSGRCYSACVFVLAGAVYRVRSNSIGIHRPYSTNLTERTYKESQAEYERLAKLAKTFLLDVNVSTSLYDAMIQVPPQKIRTLTLEEMDQFGLLETDPAKQDLDDNASARYYGVSKIEYLRRKADLEVKCSNQLKRMTNGGNADIEPYLRCEESVMGKRRKIQ